MFNTRLKHNLTNTINGSELILFIQILMRTLKNKVVQ